MTKPKPKRTSKPKPPAETPRVLVREARRDAKLKNLTGKKREMVIGWFNSAGGVPYCLRQLSKVLRIQCSTGTLYEAIAFWRVSQKFELVEAEARVMAEHDANRKGMTVEQRDAAIDANFVMLAAASGDTETLLEFRKLKLKERELDSKNKAEAQKLKQRAKELDRKERELTLNTLKWQNDVAEKILTGELRKTAEKINRQDISHAAKIAAMRAAAFADVDALEASGTLEIPKA